MSATQETHFSRKGIQQTRSHGKRNATEENERCTSLLAAMRPLSRRRCLTKLSSFGKHEKESQRRFTTLFQSRYAVLAEHVFGRRKSIKNGIGAGIAVIFEKENINSLEEDSELRITLSGAFAQSESESISANVTWGKRRAMEAGKVSIQYKKLYGYRKGEDQALCAGKEKL